MCDDKTWEKIKTQYISGGTSYSQLSNKYGIPKGTIGRKAAAQGWANLRKRIRNEVETKVVDRLSDEQADRFMLLYSIQEKYESLLDEACSMEGHRDTGLRDLGTAIATAIANKRDLYGILSEAQKQGREHIHIELEKLQLQKESHAAANGTGDMDNWVIHMEEESNGES